ncbi:hypothetical protein SEA_CAMERICO_23 [Gordonia phage Camerico]|nr:hypothetical protein SEA_CAMERICO_23 [Gordonia phage Camerico]
MMCEAMKWNFLPVAGGLYDQNPLLIDKFAVIFQYRAEHQAKEAEKQEREARKNKSKTGMGSRVSRPTGRRR